MLPATYRVDFTRTIGKAHVDAWCVANAALLHGQRFQKAQQTTPKMNEKSVKPNAYVANGAAGGFVMMKKAALQVVGVLKFVADSCFPVVFLLALCDFFRQ